MVPGTHWFLISLQKVDLMHKKHIAAGVTVMKQLNNQSALCKPSQGKMLEILCVGASLDDLRVLHLTTII